MCELREFVRRDHYRGCARRFEPCRVVETPRRARTSICSSCDDEVCPLYDLLEQLILTHYSSRYRDLAPFEQEARTIFPNTFAGDDFKRFPFPK